MYSPPPWWLASSISRLLPSALWAHLFTKSFKDQHVPQRETLSMSALQFRLEVPTDGRERASFASRCPFSFFLSRLLQGLRESVSTISASGAGTADSESIAIGQFKMLGVGHGIEDALDDSLLTDYIHDFA